MKLIAITVEGAQSFLKNHERHFKVPREPICAIGIADEGGILHGAALLGRRSDGDAELAHIYCDGAIAGYTMLYGATWRALKALGYEKTWL